MKFRSRQSQSARSVGIGKRIGRMVAAFVFLAVLMAASVQIVVQTTRELENRKLAMQATAYAMAAAAANGIASGDAAEVRASLTAVTRIPHILMATVQDETGNVIASMGQSAYLTNDVITATDGNIALLFKGHMPVTVDIIKGGEVRGKLTMLSDISSVQSHVVITVISTLAAAVLAAALGVAASFPLQRRIVRPLVTLAETMQRIRTSRDYGRNLQDDNSPDEVGVLVKSFNSLMDGIRFRDNSLQRLAYFDPLTGLPNRVSFQRSITEWLDEPMRDHNAAVVLLNVDGFRTLNDAFGHSTGDAILMTVAATIKSAIRENVVLARHGGDEFALLLPEAASESDVEMSIARIQSAFFKPLQIGELEIHINLCAGALLVYSADKPGLTDDNILRHTDLALAEAKTSIAGRVQFFRMNMVERVAEDTELGQALRVAAKAGAFELHYQCQFDVQNSSISGFEALVRWRHPVRGLVSPAVFIPLAERSGLVSVIGDWVLLEGCRQAAQWHRQGLPPRIMSVNVSPAQILTAGFIEKVRGALRKTGLPPHLLCLELTESIFVGSSYAETVIILETLSNDGVRFALDDFGTGYSSLGYLSKLPFHTIKIDRSFVDGADKDPRKGGMLRSIVGMIKVLGMSTVAEGAETSGEVALLQQLGIDKIQGYAIARPMPAAEALKRANEVDSRYARRAG